METKIKDHPKEDQSRRREETDEDQAQGKTEEEGQDQEIEEDLDQEVLIEKEEVIIEVVGDVTGIGIMTGEETEKRRQGTMKNKSRKLVRWGWRFQST